MSEYNNATEKRGSNDFFRMCIDVRFWSVCSPAGHITLESVFITLDSRYFDPKG